MLENLEVVASVRGLTASGAATVESVQWIGQQTVKVIFCDGNERQMRLRPADRPCPRRATDGGQAWLSVVVVMAVEEFECLKALDLSAIAPVAKRKATRPSQRFYVGDQGPAR